MSDKIHVSQATHKLLCASTQTLPVTWEPREVQVKGKGTMKSFLATPVQSPRDTPMFDDDEFLLASVPGGVQDEAQESNLSRRPSV